MRIAYEAEAPQNRQRREPSAQRAGARWRNHMHGHMRMFIVGKDNFEPSFAHILGSLTRECACDTMPVHRRFDRPSAESINDRGVNCTVCGIEELGSGKKLQESAPSGAKAMILCFVRSLGVSIRLCRAR